MFEKPDIAPQAPKFFHLILQKYDWQHLSFNILRVLSIEIHLLGKIFSCQKILSVAKPFCWLSDLDDLATNLQHCKNGFDLMAFNLHRIIKFIFFYVWFLDSFYVWCLGLSIQLSTLETGHYLWLGARTESKVGSSKNLWGLESGRWKKNWEEFFGTFPKDGSEKFVICTPVSWLVGG